MTTFWSCHLIVNRTIADDRRHGRDLIDTEFSHWEVFLLYFWNGLNPQTLTFFSLLRSFRGNIKYFYR